MKQMKNTEGGFEYFNEINRLKSYFDHTLINILPQKIFYKDLNSVYIYCNENYAKDLGILPEQIIGKTDFDFYPIELAEKYRSDDQWIISKGEIQHLQEDYIAKCKKCLIRTIKSPVRNDAGEIVGILGVFWTLDMVEDFIQSTNKINMEFKRFYENASDAYVKFYSNGVILDFNQAFQKMLGYRRNEIVGTNIRDFTPRKYWKLDKEILIQQVRVRGFSDAYDKQLKSKSGDIVHISAHLYRYVNGENDLDPVYWGIFRDISERVIVEEHLKRDRDIAQNYLKIAGGIVVILDRNQKVRLINKKCIQTIGYSERKIINSNWFNLVLPVKNRNDAKKVYSEMMMGKDPVNKTFEDIIVSKDGKERIFSWEHAVLFDDKGKPNGRISFGSDITEMSQVLKKLQISEERLKVAFEANDIAIFEHIVSDNKYITNERGANLIGLSLEEFYLQDDMFNYWLMHIHEDDREMISEKYGACLEGNNDRYHYDFRFRQSDGNYKWIRSYGKVVEYNSYNRAKRIIGIDYDITELKQQEIKLQENIIRYQTLLETIPDHVMIININGEIIFHNEAFVLGHGYKPGIDLRGNNIYDFIHPDYVDGLKKIDFESFAGFFNEEVKVKKADGTIMIVGVNAVPFRESVDMPVKVLVVGRDITERKNYEHSLIEAREKAVEADKMKSIFLSNMSHDVRTPLHAIMGFADLLTEDGLNQEQKDEFVSMIQKNGNNLLQLINDILDYSRIESGRISFVTSEVHLNAFLSDLKMNYQQISKQLDKDNISIHLKIPEEAQHLVIESDSSRLKQIFDNLMNNALKYSEQGEISFGFRMDSKDNPEFFIKDSGMGIPMGMQSRVFERFKQTDVACKKHFKGVGLGLAIVKGLIDQMGGYIKLESQENVGTEFRFTIKE